MTTLKDLGLTDYEAEVYETLLDCQASTAKEVVDRSADPMGGVYDVLGSLSERRMVNIRDDRKPKLYSAVDPHTALHRLLETKRQQLNAKLEHYQTIVDDLSEELRSDGPAFDNSHQVSLRYDLTAEDVCRVVSSATDEVAITVPPSRDLLQSGDSLLLSKVVDEAANQVDDVFVLAKARSNASRPSRLERLAAENPNITLQYHGSVTGLTAIIDREVYIISEWCGFIDQSEYVGIFDDGSGFTDVVHSEFRKLWVHARPYREGTGQRQTSAQEGNR